MNHGGLDGGRGAQTGQGRLLHRRAARSGR